MRNGLRNGFRTRMAGLVAACWAAGCGGTTDAGVPAIQIDGVYEDWEPVELVGTDPAGDAGPSGIDFTSVRITNDEEWIFLRFDLGVEVQPDEGHFVGLAFDVDGSAATGGGPSGSGAELVWRLGERTGTWLGGRDPRKVSHPELGLVVAPTVSTQEIEVALRRDAMLDGTSVFPNDAVSLVLFDGSEGDRLGPVRYAFREGIAADVPEIDVGRPGASTLRVASYNVEHDGLFEPDRADPMGRILRAIDADVYVFSEIWDHSAIETVERLQTLDGRKPGWHAVKRDEGNVIVSRFRIREAWEVLPGSRITAALLETGDAWPADVLVIANHWNCCAADEKRQRQADAVIAFLEDARTAGGRIDLEPGTPVVAAGDFNLVGYRRQLETILTGDVDDEHEFGPDAAPDWDGSPFTAAPARHAGARFVYTWRQDSSSYYPGRLDYVFFTASALELRQSFVLETRTMSPASLEAAGLLPADTESASDHAPLVTDFAPR